MAQRQQCGWLKKEKRAQGETWVLFFRTTRQSDGKRVENKIPIGMTTSGYEAMILIPEQAYAIVCNVREPERTLTLLAAGTGLRISECLGLQMA